MPKVERHTTRRRNLWLETAMVVVLLVCSAGASAQERGQYIPGTRGLNSGIQPPPGFTYANYFIWYPSNRLNNRHGDKVVDIDVDLIIDFNMFAYTTKYKIAGANYGFAVAVPISNTAISLPRVGAGFDTVGLADMYIEPINLGWTRPKWNVLAAYGFVAPTGRYDADDPTNSTTTDFWGHEVTIAATRYLDQKKLWQLSVSTVWEFHQKKRHEDVRVGDNVTVEYGVGKIWVHNKGQRLVQFGAAGYAEFQLDNDSGSDVVPFNQGANDRVFALGPEFGMIWPVKKFNFLIRVLPEFGARSRTSGLTFVAVAGKTF